MKAKRIITRKEVYFIVKRYKIYLGKFKIADDGLIDVDGDVKISNTNREKLPLKFGKVTGDFHCNSNLLTTLKNSPYHVGGSFHCDNNQLTSLKYGPKNVGENFNCMNNQLRNLTGSPVRIHESYYCSGNELTTLMGGPEDVGMNYYADHHFLLIDLRGSPKKIGGDFYARGSELINLIGCPQEIGGTLTISPSVHSLYMGGKNCKVKSVSIESHRNIGFPMRIPQIIYLNQKHLAKYMKYNDCLNLWTDGCFDEDLFADFLMDIMDGFE